MCIRDSWRRLMCPSSEQRHAPYDRSMASSSPGAERARPQIGQPTKNAIRAAVRASRAARTPNERLADDRARTELLLAALDGWTPTVVAAYASAGGEPGTGELLEALATRGVAVLLPLLSPTAE